MLTDSFSRKLDYLRVSITDRCNLRCSYCMPPEGVKLLPHDDVLRNEEFVYFVSLFARLGIKKVRFTGGEPLLRKGIMNIISDIRKEAPDLDLCLTTNGVLLDEFLGDFKDNFVKKLNISLDTFNTVNYEKLTGRNYLTKVLNNIDKAIAHNFFEIKINSVLLKSTLHELDSFLDYFKDKHVTLRFIELMPFISKEMEGFLAAESLVKVLSEKGHITRVESSDTKVAQKYEFLYKGYAMKIGIIPTLSHNFCSKCNRLRLTCDGFLKTCLHSNHEIDIKTPYRQNLGEDCLTKLILDAARQKQEKHSLDCTSGQEGCASFNVVRAMSKIGG